MLALVLMDHYLRHTCPERDVRLHDSRDHERDWTGPVAERA
jgi:hypothetical protein